MKKFVLASVIAFCGFSQTAQAADEYFHRKAGLWEISTQTDARPGNGHTVKYCLDEKTDIELTKMGDAAGQMCSKHEMHKDGATYTSSSVCNMMGSTIESHGVFKGDFSSNYEGDINSTYNPPFMGKATGHIKISGRWLGACTAGMEPGDMVMPNGLKMNIGKMAQMGARLK